MLVGIKVDPRLILAVLKWSEYFTDRQMKLTVIAHEAIECCLSIEAI
jgi:hypothetical protein